MTSMPGEFIGEAEAAMPPTRAGRLLLAFDTATSRVIEAAAAALVAAEVVLLGTSTAARYVFSHPFTW